jgi:threonine synthase
MKYFSLNKQSPQVNFREATLLGQAPDKGLYFPEKIPQINPDFLATLKTQSPTSIGMEIMQPFVGDCIPPKVFERIINETLSFPVPLVPVTEKIASLELYHGPTLAFKDVGARFMSRCLGYFAQERTGRVLVLVATSGDTGGAVADGFYDVDGVDVVILYPSGKVSPVQELQLTTYGKNIHAIEVMDDFDACQRLVKMAFADDEIRSSIFLTSANSINVARWLPQQLYYFVALQQWQEKNPPIISVPSGNFGNICAGMMAAAGGLPITHFIAAVNANDVVYNYLQTGNYTITKAVPTLSNAMDVGDPSNFVRIMQIFGNSFPALKNNLGSYRITDDETIQTISSVYQKTGYTLDPHGAVAYLALERYLEKHQAANGFFLETAHPVKFPAAVERGIGKPIEVPEQVQQLFTKEKKSIQMMPDGVIFKDYLLEMFGK